MYHQPTDKTERDRQIVERLRAGESQAAIARAYNITTARVGQIRKRAEAAARRSDLGDDLPPEAA